MTRETRTIHVDYLARVEGEGSLTLVVEDGRATEARLAIFEPPRLFEALLRGRAYDEAPDITSRICGICPVAYLMSACHAMEDALGVRVDGALRDLRRLMLCGEWIESHALHVFLLHAPDFLGYPDALSMAREHRVWIERGLSIKRAGNALVALLGGREIHPVSVRVGGFYGTPSARELAALRPELVAARDLAEACLPWAAALPVPDLERDYAFVALRGGSNYVMLDGRVVSLSGLDVDVHDYDAHFVEEQAPWSTALRSRMQGRAYLCGPLARFAVNEDLLRPSVRDAARRAGLRAPCKNPFRSLLVRLVEILEALEEAIDIVDAYRAPAAPSVPVVPAAATGFGATEAPRGMLYHRYVLDAEGTILDAKISPPTAQSQLAIEEDLVALAPDLATLPAEDATLRAEQAIRNHDPCISCAAHFLRLKAKARARSRRP